MYDISEDCVQLPQRVEAVEIMRDSGRATPADPSSIGKKSSKSDLNSRGGGHAYYNDAFAVREEGKKVPAAAGVWVEMKTNVIVCLRQITSSLNTREKSNMPVYPTAGKRIRLHQIPLPSHR